MQGVYKDPCACPGGRVSRRFLDLWMLGGHVPPFLVSDIFQIFLKLPFPFIDLSDTCPCWHILKDITDAIALSSQAIIKCFYFRLLLITILELYISLTNASQFLFVLQGIATGSCLVSLLCVNITRYISHVGRLYCICTWLTPLSITASSSIDITASDLIFFF